MLKPGNLFFFQGGVQFNVVPAELSVGFDIRVTPTEDLKQFEKKIEGWCKEAGDDVTFEFKQSVGALILSRNITAQN